MFPLSLSSSARMASTLLTKLGMNIIYFSDQFQLLIWADSEALDKLIEDGLLYTTTDDSWVKLAWYSFLKIIWSITSSTSYVSHTFFEIWCSNNLFNNSLKFVYDILDLFQVIFQFFGMKICPILMFANQLTWCVENFMRRSNIWTCSINVSSTILTIDIVLWYKKVPGTLYLLNSGGKFWGSLLSFK